MSFKKHDRTLKVIATAVAVVVAIVMIKVEIDAQRNFNATADTQGQDLQKKKPFYDCLFSAAAIADENSPKTDQLAAISASDECYDTV